MNKPLGSCRNLRQFQKRPEDRSLEPVLNGGKEPQREVRVPIESLSHKSPWTPLLASQVLMAVELQQVKVGAFCRNLRQAPGNLPKGEEGQEGIRPMSKKEHGTPLPTLGS